MKKKMHVILLSVFMLFAFSNPSFAWDEAYTAEIKLFAGNFAPRGFALCEGQILPISQNTALFSLIGTTYGGDGRTTFALPDLREAEKALGGARYIIALHGIFPSRN